MQKFTACCLPILLLFTANEIFAQQDSADFRSMNEIVVTGQYRPQSLKKSVYQVKIIPAEKIKLSGATQVQQVLNTELGFRFTNDKALGIADVQLNGLGGNNVKILLDGIPMTDRYDERISLSQIDINNIERIEIVEGPMSVSYGTDAMAGVINLITKKNPKNEWGITARVQEETAGDEYYPFSYKGTHIQNVQLNYAKNHLVASLGGTHNDFDGFGGDEYGRGKSWKPKEQWLGNAKFGYVNDRLNLYYRIDGLHEDIVIRNPINMNNYKAVDQQFKTDRYIHQLQGTYNASNRMQWTGFVSYTDYKRQTQTTRRNLESNTIEPNQAGENDLSKLNSLSFKTSMQYRLSSKISLQPGIDINHEKASGDRIAGNKSIEDYALFVSAEISPISDINIRPGVRFSTNSRYDAPPVIPSVNTKFSLNKNLDLRLAYGYGFRAPTLRELYLDFVDVNHNLVGNTALKAEHAHSINGSLQYKAVTAKKISWTATLSGFYNAFQNQIELMQTAGSDEYTYYNIDKSKTTGGSLENRLSGKNWDASIGISYTGFSSNQYNDDSYIKEDNREMLWTPEVNSNLVYRFDKLKTSIGLFYKFVGKKPAFSYGTIDGQDAIILTHIAPYHLADLTATTTINKWITATAGVKNLFDVTRVDNTVITQSATAHTSAGPLSVGYGRSFFAGLTFQWKKNN